MENPFFSFYLSFEDPQTFPGQNCKLNAFYHNRQLSLVYAWCFSVCTTAAFSLAMLLEVELFK